LKAVRYPGIFQIENSANKWYTKELAIVENPPDYSLFMGSFLRISIWRGPL